ncbi:hypothetical protein HY643_04135 [Candidatus Woesearchaeota archaeon]|nr:hypothetical protein [Candidatus Woesearchaeota archaeon]
MNGKNIAFQKGSFGVYIQTLNKRKGSIVKKKETPITKISLKKIWICLKFVTAIKKNKANKNIPCGNLKRKASPEKNPTKKRFLLTIKK